MVSFFIFPAPAFALSHEFKTDDLQALDLADILTSEFLEEDEEDRKHKEEYWGLSIQGQPSSVPLSRPPSTAPSAIASTMIFSSTSVTVNPSVAHWHPLPVWSQEGERDNEMEPVASGSVSPLAILPPVPRASPAATSAPVTPLPSAKALGKKRARDDNGDEQPAKRRCTSSREEAPVTQAPSAPTASDATNVKPERRGAHAGYEDPILVSEPAQTCACPLEGCDESFAANKKAANAHLRQSHGLKHMATDAEGRVSCSCKVEGGVVCDGKISRGEYGRHLVERHLPKEELTVWKCPREGCTYEQAARKSSAERHVRTCFNRARKKAAKGH
ncbi:hypothetical protein B0H21DRAFT_706833 [Amylocystis lapponica]|nr:hypothetical protein B0H21DRAFT_706833 [Amylocystis lapponica]